MRTVEISRFVRARPREIERLLAPETILEYEGTFTAVAVDETEAGVVIDARAGGRLIEARFVFEERENGYTYRQDGTAGPFEAMETTLTVGPQDEGARASTAIASSCPRRSSEPSRDTWWSSAGSRTDSTAGRPKLRTAGDAPIASHARQTLAVSRLFVGGIPLNPTLNGPNGGTRLGVRGHGRLG